MSKADFDILYREHYTRVLGLCRRVLGGMSDSEEAKDATQEVFMRGYKAYAQYRPQDPFGAWIGTIATNYCIDLLRRHRRLALVFDESSDEAVEPVDPSTSGVGTLVSAHRAETINRAVDTLPENYRLPIVLAYYSGASYDEIAETLGITTNHVGILLLRGRARLRRDLIDFDEEKRNELSD